MTLIRAVRNCHTARGVLGRLPRLMVDNLTHSDRVLLGREQSHYLTKVMRRGVDARVRLFNHCDGEWLAEVSSASPRKSELRLIEQMRVATEPHRRTTLLFAMLKNSRMATVVEKATELGVHVLQPIRTHRSIGKEFNLNRMRAISTEAAEQCERLDVPLVLPPAELSAVIESWPSDAPLLVCDERGGSRTFSSQVSQLADSNVGVFVGPEGGFTDDEFAMLDGCDAALSVGLGNNILRAETASIAALSLLHCH